MWGGPMPSCLATGVARPDPAEVMVVDATARLHISTFGAFSVWTDFKNQPPPAYRTREFTTLSDYRATSQQTITGFTQLSALAYRSSRHYLETPSSQQKWEASLTTERSASG